MKTLFIETNYSEDFYLKQRNKIENVTCKHMFRNNDIISRLFRRLFLKLHLPVYWFFGEWSKKINDYDIAILPVSIYSNSIIKLFKGKEEKLKHWYWNSIFTTLKPEDLNASKKNIYTFDLDDSINYGINFLDTYYFSSIEIAQEKPKYDICFIGADKGRLEYLLKLERFFNDNGLKSYFHIVRSERNQTEYKYKDRIGYKEVLNIISDSKMILDVVQEGQQGKTQRPLEALFLKKKLITTDPTVSKYDFYNVNNIFVIKDLNDSHLQKFISSSMVEIDEIIKNKYDFKNWIKKITNNE